MLHRTMRHITTASPRFKKKIVRRSIFCRGDRNVNEKTFWLAAVHWSTELCTISLCR